MRANRGGPRWPRYLAGTKVELDSLQVVVFYEDGPAAMLARDSFQQAFPWLAREAGRHLPMWEFDMVQTATLRANAARDGSRSDIGCVSIRGEEALPARVKECLEEALVDAPDHPCALVAGLGFKRPVMTNGKAAVMNYLRGVARRRHAEFFCECWIVCRGGPPLNCPAWNPDLNFVEGRRSVEAGAVNPGNSG